MKHLDNAIGHLVFAIATAIVVVGIILVAVPILVIGWAVWIWDNNLRRKP